MASGHHIGGWALLDDSAPAKGMWQTAAFGRNQKAIHKLRHLLSECLSKKQDVWKE
jgi:hypothetical protein